MQAIGKKYELKTAIETSKDALSDKLFSLEETGEPWLIDRQGSDFLNLIYLFL